MTDEEKSEALAKLCGWIRPAGLEYRKGLWLIDIPDSLLWSNHYWNSEPFGIGFNLYESQNMAQAWRVLNWAVNNDILFMRVTSEWSHANMGNGLIYDQPEKAQRWWLDMVLESAINAGMIDGIKSMEE